jgi:hypothetical protein
MRCALWDVESLSEVMLMVVERLLLFWINSANAMITQNATIPTEKIFFSLASFIFLTSYSKLNVFFLVVHWYYQLFLARNLSFGFLCVA